MTAHDHREYVHGCHRCELGHDEAMDALVEERDEYQAALEEIRDLPTERRRQLGVLVRHEQTHVDEARAIARRALGDE